MNKIERSKFFYLKPTAFCLAFLSAFSLQADAAVGDVFGQTKVPANGAYNVTGNEVYDSMDVMIEPTISWNEYFISAEGGNSFTVKQNTKFVSTSSSAVEEKWRGTNSFYAVGYDEKGEQKSAINLMGDIHAYVEHKVTGEPPEGNDDLQDVGANLFYAKDGGVITLGGVGTTTKAWVIAEIPDLISAKHGGMVDVKSIRNEFVGSIDLVDPNGPAQINPDYDPNKPEDDANKPDIVPSSIVKAKFVGRDSYWYGDEHSFMNFGVNTMQMKDLLERNHLLYDLGALVSEEITVSEIARIVQDFL